jgi:hypothetical protein
MKLLSILLPVWWGFSRLVNELLSHCLHLWFFLFGLGLLHDTLFPLPFLFFNTVLFGVPSKFFKG